jgi:hypothetical protein
MLWWVADILTKGGRKRKQQPAHLLLERSSSTLCISTTLFAQENKTMMITKST